MAERWASTPRRSVEAECLRRGRGPLVDGCIDLVTGTGFDEGLVAALAGPASADVLAGRKGGRDGYWPRVWALRGLLYVWDDAAGDAVVAATADRSWRVREMAAKVIGRHALDEGLEAAVALGDDPVPRVRQAAERARARLVVG